MIPSPREENLANYVNPSTASRESFRFLEGWMDGNQRIQTRSGNVPFGQVEDFLKNADLYALPHGISTGAQFRVISFSRLRAITHPEAPLPKLPGGNYRPFLVGLPKDTFQLITKCWGLHDCTLEAILNNNGVFADFSTPDRLSMVIKVANSASIGYDCVSITHDPIHRITYVLYHGLEDEAGVFSTLQTSPQRCMHPVFFAAVLYRSHQQHVERHRYTIDIAVLETERATGFGRPGRLGSGHIPHHEFKEVDYKSTVKMLSYCQTDIAIIGHVARFSVDCGNWLVGRLTERRDRWNTAVGGLAGENCTTEKGKSGSSLREANTGNPAEILEEIEYSRCRAMTALSQIQQMSGRVQSQTTVICSVIAQNEAEYTAAIAVDSKRDSTAMKTIAVLTVLFLPGTFVATFFSMNMINWDPSGNSQPKLSKYIWVYWLISIPLTFLVLAFWFYWSRQEHENVQRRLMRSKSKKSKDLLNNDRKN